MATAKCELCHKKIEFREKECDESGLTWHSHCFRCRVCGVPLNENNVRVRGENQNELYCKSHAIYEAGHQPTCKIYFLSKAYRLVF